MDGHRDCHTKSSKSDGEGEISCDYSYVQNLKGNDTNELTYRTERDSQTQKTYLWFPGRRDSKGLWKGYAADIFNMCFTLY